MANREKATGEAMICKNKKLCEALVRCAAREISMFSLSGSHH